MEKQVIIVDLLLRDNLSAIVTGFQGRKVILVYSGEHTDTGPLADSHTSGPNDRAKTLVT